MNEYISNQARKEVAPPMPDALAQAIQQSNLTNTDMTIKEGLGENEVVEEANGGHGGPPNTVPPPVYDSEIVGTAGGATISLEVDYAAFTVMKNELASAHETIAKQKDDLARTRSTCLQLENQVSSGMYFL